MSCRISIRSSSDLVAAAPVDSSLRRVLQSVAVSCRMIAAALVDVRSVSYFVFCRVLF